MCSQAHREEELLRLLFGKPVPVETIKKTESNTITRAGRCFLCPVQPLNFSEPEHHSLQDRTQQTQPGHNAPGTSDAGAWHVLPGL